MNARALLQAQGWRGDGHTLHATSDSIGLKKRLIVGRKGNTAGLGASQYVNDQWWLSALDEQLSGIDTSGGKVVQTTKDGKLDRLNDNRSPLYKLFVRGGTLDGTVDILPTETAKKAPEKNEPLHIKATLAVRKPPSSMIASRDETESSSSSSEPTSKTKESKEERRARKAARRERRERKRARREAKKQKTSATSSDADSSSKSSKAEKSETKEERRARREARRKRREEKETRRLRV